MPGSVSIAEAKAQPVLSPDVDFAMCLIGYSSASPLAAGKVSVLYSSPAALASDYGIGDAVDAATQAITKTDGNPAPPPIAIYPTPATTAGAMGSIATSLVGTAIPVAASSAAPKGTYEVKIRVVDDGNGGAGTAIGTAGIILQASLNAGRAWLPTFALGTSDTFTVYLPGSVDTGVKFELRPPSSELTALYTKLNTLKTTVVAHFGMTSGSPAIHLAADTADATALTAVANATTPATAVTLFNAIKQYLGVHGASTSYHGAADAALASALAAIATAVIVEDVDLRINALISAYNAHRVLVGGSSVHGSADSTNTITAYTAVPGTLNTGDTWSCPTTPPMWGDTDLYDAGPPATGAFAAIAESSLAFGLLIITEPVAAGDFATLVAGLNYGRSTGKRWTLIVRFRDPAPDEADAAYIADFLTFAAANQDNRISCVAGSGWLTDAFRGYVYLRSGLPALLARLQGNAVVPGKLGERLAQHPGFVGRGPLEGFSLVDDTGNLIGHDEQIRGGIDGPINDATGGGITFYRIPNTDLPGTFISEAPVMYPTLSEIVTLMDRRVANGVERVASAIAWTEIQGADIYDAATLALDPDVRDGIAGKIAKAIKDRYANEIQNADDPNLVVINDTVSVSGSKVTISGVLNVRLFGYTDTIELTFSATR